MRRELPAEVVKKLAGHSSLKMTEYSSRAAIPEMVAALESAMPAADGLFELGPPQKNHPAMTTMYIQFQKLNTKITTDSKITNTSCIPMTVFTNQTKKYISTMVQRLFRLRRRIENSDWDFDYNRQHPTKEPRQNAPDISDEEYAEKSKED